MEHQIYFIRQATDILQARIYMPKPAVMNPTYINLLRMSSQPPTTIRRRDERWVSLPMSQHCLARAHKRLVHDCYRELDAQEVALWFSDLHSTRIK